MVIKYFSFNTVFFMCSVFRVHKVLCIFTYVYYLTFSKTCCVNKTDALALFGR